MKFDFKVTGWERVTVPEDKEQLVLDAIKNGTVETSSDVYDLLDDDGVDYEVLDDCNEQMTVEENGNQATIEVRENGDVIHNNCVEVEVNFLIICPMSTETEYFKADGSKTKNRDEALMVSSIEEGFKKAELMTSYLPTFEPITRNVK